jgi:hypothetical protein
MIVAVGTSSCASSIRFGNTSPVNWVTPVTLAPGRFRVALRGPADLVLHLLNELSKLVGDALSLHEENLASQSPDVRLSIGGDRPRHRETKSND